MLPVFKGNQICHSFYYATKVSMVVLWNLVLYLLLNVAWTTCQHARKLYTMVMDWHCQLNLTTCLVQPTTNLLLWSLHHNSLWNVWKHYNGPWNQTFLSLQRFTNSHPFDNHLFVTQSNNLLELAWSWFFASTVNVVFCHDTWRSYKWQP